MDDYMHIYVCFLMCEQKLKQKLTCLQEGLVQEGQHSNLHLEVETESLPCVSHILLRRVLY